MRPEPEPGAGAEWRDASDEELDQLLCAVAAELCEDVQLPEELAPARVDADVRRFRAAVHPPRRAAAARRVGAMRGLLPAAAALAALALGTGGAALLGPGDDGGPAGRLAAAGPSAERAGPEPERGDASWYARIVRAPERSLRLADARLGRDPQRACAAPSGGAAQGESWYCSAVPRRLR